MTTSLKSPGPKAESSAGIGKTRQVLALCLLALLVMSLAAGGGWLLRYILQSSRSPAMPKQWTVDKKQLLRKAGFIAGDFLQSAPSLNLRDTDNNSLTNSDIQGKVLFLNFWGTNCLSCQQELLALEQLAGRYRDRGLRVVCVCVDEEDADVIRDVFHRHVKTLPAYVDAAGTTRRRFDVQLLPTTFLVDRSGRLLGRAEGTQNWLGDEMRNLLDALCKD